VVAVTILVLTNQFLCIERLLGVSLCLKRPRRTLLYKGRATRPDVTARRVGVALRAVATGDVISSRGRPVEGPSLTSASRQPTAPRVSYERVRDITLVVPVMGFLSQGTGTRPPRLF